MTKSRVKLFIINSRCVPPHNIASLTFVLSKKNKLNPGSYCAQ
nr:MAG TPA_asm: hypothetical protein [Caudoviricetes sp.]